MPTVYRVKAPTGHQKWAPSNSLAKKTRSEMCSELGLKRTEVEVDAVEIPKAKTDLITWLNQHFKMAAE